MLDSGRHNLPTFLRLVVLVLSASLVLIINACTSTEHDDMWHVTIPVWNEPIQVPSNYNENENPSGRFRGSCYWFDVLASQKKTTAILLFIYYTRYLLDGIIRFHVIF
jgi:hypothetical protein